MKNTNYIRVILPLFIIKKKHTTKLQVNIPFSMNPLAKKNTEKKAKFNNTILVVVVFNSILPL